MLTSDYVGSYSRHGAEQAPSNQCGSNDHGRVFLADAVGGHQAGMFLDVSQVKGKCSHSSVVCVAHCLTSQIDHFDIGLGVGQFNQPCSVNS